jgi:hypothetical protein
MHIGAAFFAAITRKKNLRRRWMRAKRFPSSLNYRLSTTHFELLNAFLS